MEAYWTEDGPIDAHQPTVSFSWDTVRDAGAAPGGVFDRVLAQVVERARNTGPVPALGGFIAYLKDVDLPPAPDAAANVERGQWWMTFCDVDPVSRLSHRVPRLAVVLNYSGRTDSEDEEDRNAVTIMRAVDRILRTLHAECGAHLGLLEDGRLAVPIITIDARDTTQAANLCQCEECRKRPAGCAPAIGRPAESITTRRDAESNLRQTMGQRPIPPLAKLDAGFKLLVERSREAAGPDGTVHVRHDRFCLGCGEEMASAKACAKCRKAFFCSAECQRKCWKAHKLACGKPPLE
jgi:hypothetical protein